MPKLADKCPPFLLTVWTICSLTSLASSSKERTDCGFHKYQIDESYELKVVDKISESNKNFQTDCINTLLRMRDNIPSHNAVLLNNFGNDLARCFNQVKY